MPDKNKARREQRGDIATPSQFKKECDRVFQQQKGQNWEFVDVPCILDFTKWISPHLSREILAWKFCHPHTKNKFQLAFSRQKETGFCFMKWADALPTAQFHPIGEEKKGFRVLKSRPTGSPGLAEMKMMPKQGRKMRKGVEKVKYSESGYHEMIKRSITTYLEKEAKSDEVKKEWEDFWANDVYDTKAQVPEDKKWTFNLPDRKDNKYVNAGSDASNVAPSTAIEQVLLLPKDPDRSAREYRRRIKQLTGSSVGIIINDSVGRAWRLGTTSLAIGVAGVTALEDHRGKPDLFGVSLKVSEEAIADELASAATLLQGQAAEKSPVVLIRGFTSSSDGQSAASLIRPLEQDLFR